MTKTEKRQLQKRYGITRSELEKRLVHDGITREGCGQWLFISDYLAAQ